MRTVHVGVRYQHYSAYGLNIRSEIPLPTTMLESSAVSSDIEIRIDTVERWKIYAPIRTHYVIEVSDGVLLHWDKIGTYLVRNGREIIVDPSPNGDIGLLQLVLIGAVMAVLLYQRGLLVLHASAVEVNGSGVAFVGAKGAGKSTLAAVLCSRNHSLLADDVVAIDLAGNTPSVLPAFPQIKLLPDSVTMLDHDPEILPRFSQLIDKRELRTAPVPASRIPLSRIYMLDKSSKAEIQGINGPEKLFGLLPHWYCARFLDVFWEGVRLDHFSQCTNLLGRIPLYRLCRTSDPTNLDDLVQMVEQHTSMGR